MIRTNSYSEEVASLKIFTTNHTENLFENHRTIYAACETPVYCCTLHLAIRGAQVVRCARNGWELCSRKSIGAALGNGRLEIMCTASAEGTQPERAVRKGRLGMFT